MLGWSNLSPPTSISDAGKFLTICNRFSAAHNFFATDPASMLARMNLDPADFTDPAIDDKTWNLYPNAQMILQVWQMTADYVGAVVDAGYASDEAVAADTDLANWISAASGAGQRGRSAEDGFEGRPEIRGHERSLPDYLSRYGAAAQHRYAPAFVCSELSAVPAEHQHSRPPGAAAHLGVTEDLSAEHGNAG